MGMSVRQGHRGFLWLIAVLVSLVVALDAALAQESATAGPIWELSAFGGLLDDRPEFEPREEFQLAHQGLFGLRAAHRLRSGFFLEGEVLYAPMEFGALRGPDSPEKLAALFMSGGVGFNLPVTGRLRPFARAGGGIVRWDGGSADEYDFAFHFGNGVRILLTPGLALRTDVRLHFLPSALATTRRALRPDLRSAGEMLWMVGVNAGFSIFLGHRNAHEGVP